MDKQDLPGRIDRFFKCVEWYIHWAKAEHRLAHPDPDAPTDIDPIDEILALQSKEL